MLKNTKDIMKKNFFSPIIPIGAVRYSCPIRLVPTNIPPGKERRLLGKFQSMGRRKLLDQLGCLVHSVANF